MGATQGPAGGDGTGRECQARAPPADSSGPAPSSITWKVFSLNSWCEASRTWEINTGDLRAEAGLRGRAAPALGPTLSRLSPSWKDIPWPERAVVVARHSLPES